MPRFMGRWSPDNRIELTTPGLDFVSLTVSEDGSSIRLTVNPHNGAPASARMVGSDVDLVRAFLARLQPVGRGAESMSPQASPKDGAS